MKVKELIELLKREDPEQDVVIDHPDDDYQIIYGDSQDGPVRLIPDLVSISVAEKAAGYRQSLKG